MLDLRIGYVLDMVEWQLFIGNDIGVCIVFLPLIKLKQGLAEAGLGLRFGLYLINSDMARMIALVLNCGFICSIDTAVQSAVDIWDGY